MDKIDFSHFYWSSFVDALWFFAFYLFWNVDFFYLSWSKWWKSFISLVLMANKFIASDKEVPVWRQMYVDKNRIDIANLYWQTVEKIAHGMKIAFNSNFNKEVSCSLALCLVQQINPLLYYILEDSEMAILDLNCFPWWHYWVSFQQPKGKTNQQFI